MKIPFSATGTRTGWDPKYEFKAIALLSIGFGLVGLDRTIIYPLFPVISKDLGLNYQDLGLISAVLALCWGIASIFSGRLSDRIGHKKVLVPAVIIFSLLVAGSGLAVGLLSLLLIRSVMGVAEGAYVPASIVATIEASKPSRTGMNVGLQQLAAPLFGLGLGPVIAVAMLKVVPNWHWIFGIIAIPGLLVAALLARVLRADSPVPVLLNENRQPRDSSWFEVLRYKNVVLNALLMICSLSCLVVLSAFMPSYLTDYLKLTLDQMSLVLAGLGVGSCVGVVVLPALSDRLGRKPVILAALLLEIGCLLLLMHTNAEPGMLFTLLSIITLLIAGVIGITIGPLTNESVPSEMGATATGIVVGLGEIVGGALVPAVTGGIAQHVGISVVLQIALIAVVIGFAVTALGIKEPRLSHELKPV